MCMTFRAITSAFLILGCAQLTSCAYMQTHKNIEEAQTIRTGYELTSDIELYRAGGRYYVAISKQQLRKKYPVIHDSIFLTGNNDPTWQKVGAEETTVYHPVSTGTATVLQRQDGYASIEVLADELKNNNDSWVACLPTGAGKCSVKAEITGTNTIWEGNEPPQSCSMLTRFVSIVDQVCIDWPGTLAYNVAIPVMAPFVFFHQFLNEN